MRDLSACRGLNLVYGTNTVQTTQYPSGLPPVGGGYAMYEFGYVASLDFPAPATQSDFYEVIEGFLQVGEGTSNVGVGSGFYLVPNNAPGVLRSTNPGAGVNLFNYLSNAVRVDMEDNTFASNGGYQMLRLKRPEPLIIPFGWMLRAMWVAAGALGNPTTVQASALFSYGTRG